jgi:hypothetical protein
MRVLHASTKGEKAMNAATPEIATLFEEDDWRPEFASAAVVYLPESHDPHAREIEAWARHASFSRGFGAPEEAEGELDESLVEILYRVAANLVR